MSPDDMRIEASRPDITGPMAPCIKLSPRFEEVDGKNIFHGNFNVHLDLTEYLVERVAIYGEAYWLRKGVTVVPLPRLQFNRQVMQDLSDTKLIFPSTAVAHAGETKNAFNNGFWGRNSLDKALFAALPKMAEVQDVSKFRGKLVLLNGILDIKTRVLTLHPKDFVTFAHIPVEYNPSAKCPKTDEVMSQIFTEEQHRSWKAMVGARLTGIPIQYYCIFHGRGGQGKGVLRDHTKKFFGPTFTIADMTNFKDRFRSQIFVGKTLIWNSEVPSNKQQAELMNDITGGTDLLVELKGINGLTPIAIQCLICTDVNLVAELPDSMATRRRLQYYVMESFFTDGEEDLERKVYKKNRTVIEEITTPEELSGFLNEVLDDAEYFLDKKQLRYQMPDSLDIFNAKANSIEEFVSEFTEVLEDTKTRVVTLKEAYGIYCSKDNNSSKPSYSLRDYIRSKLHVQQSGNYFIGLLFDKEAFENKYKVKLSVK
jgi:phage/plasmid-associated DNA primase